RPFAFAKDYPAWSVDAPAFQPTPAFASARFRTDAHSLLRSPPDRRMFSGAEFAAPKKSSARPCRPLARLWPVHREATAPPARPAIHPQAQIHASTQHLPVRHG